MNKLCWSLVALILILMLVLAACSGGTPSTTSPAAPPSSSVATPTTSFTDESGPRIPHNGAYTTCFSCHQTGNHGASEFPADHASYLDSLRACQKCHPGS